MRQNWNHTVCVRDEGYTAIWEFSYDEDENLGQGRFEGFIRQEGTTLYRHYDETHFERGYDAEEVEELLKKAGFAKWAKLDGYGAGRASKKSEKLLYACGG
jgi:endo-1,4-beta-mannosidase